MRDADQRPQQIEWIDIPPHVAAFDRALHQRIHRSLDLPPRAFIESRWASDKRIQRGGDDLLCRDVIDEQQHPRSQGFNRRHGPGESAFRFRQLLHLAPVHRLDQRVTGGKVPIQRSGSHPRLCRDVIQARVRAVARKRFFRDFQKTFAIPLRIHS